MKKTFILLAFIPLLLGCSNAPKLVEVCCGYGKEKLTYCGGCMTYETMKLILTEDASKYNYLKAYDVSMDKNGKNSHTHHIYIERK